MPAVHGQETFQAMDLLVPGFHVIHDSNPFSPVIFNRDMSLKLPMIITFRRDLMEIEYHNSNQSSEDD